MIKSNPLTDKTFKKISVMKSSVKRGLKLGLFDIGRKIKPDIKRSILDKNKTGRIYLVRLGGNIIRHQASAPGEPPAKLTGKLQRSVNYRLRKGGDQIEIGAGDNRVNYARSLELGRQNMAPRPYLKPAINKNNKIIIEYISKRILESINR